MAARNSHTDVVRVLKEGEYVTSEEATRRAVALASQPLSRPASGSAPAAGEQPPAPAAVRAAPAAPAAPSPLPSSPCAGDASTPASPSRTPKAAGAAASEGLPADPGTPPRSPFTVVSAASLSALSADIAIEAVPVPLPAAELLYRVPPTKAYDGLFDDGAASGGAASAAPSSSPLAGAGGLGPRAPFARALQLSPAGAGSFGAMAQLFDPGTLKQLFEQGQLGPVFASQRLNQLMGSGEVRRWLSAALIPSPGTLFWVRSWRLPPLTLIPPSAPQLG